MGLALAKLDTSKESPLCGFSQLCQLCQLFCSAQCSARGELRGAEATAASCLLWLFLPLISALWCSLCVWFRKHSVTLWAIQEVTRHDNTIMSNLANLEVHFLMVLGLMDAGQSLKESWDSSDSQASWNVRFNASTYLALSCQTSRSKIELRLIRESSDALRRLLSGQEAATLQQRIMTCLLIEWGIMTVLCGRFGGREIGFWKMWNAEKIF